MPNDDAAPAAWVAMDDNPAAAPPVSTSILALRSRAAAAIFAFAAAVSASTSTVVWRFLAAWSMRSLAGAVSASTSTVTFCGRVRYSIPDLASVVSASAWIVSFWSRPNWAIFPLAAAASTSTSISAVGRFAISARSCSRKSLKSGRISTPNWALIRSSSAFSRLENPERFGLISTFATPAVYSAITNTPRFCLWLFSGFPPDPRASP